MSDSDKNSNENKNSKNNKTITDSKNPGRRKLLKAGGVVASTALIPEKWQKPVVDTVLLPAHAMTSAPLVGAVLISGALTPTQPAPSMMAKPDSGVLDTLINPAWAVAPTPVTPSPIPLAPTPAPTVSPTASPTASPTPSPIPLAPTPAPTVSPTTSPTPAPVCAATGQCIGVTPPNGSNQVQVSITNVGTGMLAMTGALTYQGTLAGITIAGFFIDQTFSNTQGTLSGSGCNGTFTAVIGGNCIPAV